MSVKRAVTVCSLDVALDILKGPLPPEDTVGTRAYLRKCHKLFQIFNNNKEVDPQSYKQLISIMMWFDTRYKEVKQNRLRSTNSLKDHWKEFIPRITYKDLKRTIWAFLGVVQYVQMHHPEIHIYLKQCVRMMWKITFHYNEPKYQEGNQPHYNFLSHLPP